MKKTKSRFSGKVGKDVARQQREASSYGYLNLPKGVNVWSAKPGSRNVLLDILPYEVTSKKHPDRNEEEEIAVEGSLWYKSPIWTHRNVGAGNDTVICPLMTAKKPCPICEYRAKLQKQGADKEDIKALRPSKRNLYVVVPLNDREEEAVPHIFDIADYNFQKLLNEEIQTDDSVQIFPDLEEGLTLKVRFDSSTVGGGKPYAEASRIDFEERKEAYDESILEEVPKLDDVINILPYDELQAKFFEVDTEEVGEDIEEEEEETPRSKREKRHTETRSSTPRRRKIEEEEEEEEEEETDDDDDEEEEDTRPSARKTSSRTKPRHSKKEEEEDEEEPDDDEEEEEEEAPRSRMSRSSKPAPGKDTSKKPTGGKNKCPHGHRFGIDAEDFKECETCGIWSDCLDEKERR